MALNKVMLIGNVGKKPEIRYLENQNQGNTPAPKVASFTLATSERFKDRNGETRENTEWHNIVAWRNLADLAEKYISTGSQIYVEGRLRSRSWDGQDGQKHYITEIIADSIQLLGKKGDNPATQTPASTTAAQTPASTTATQTPTSTTATQTPTNAAPAADDSDDLPF